MTTNDTQRLRVFLCYAKEDRDKAFGIYQRLRVDGIDIWLDEINLLPGQERDIEIQNALRESEVVVVCLTNVAINKDGHIHKEIKSALDIADTKPEGSIFIIPAKLEDCVVPERLNRWQWVNLFDVQEKGYERLLLSLRICADRLKVDLVPKIQIENNFVSNRKQKAVEVLKIGNMELVRVPAGRFLMGSHTNTRFADDNEKPQHEVDVPYDYLIGRFPVTIGQFSEFIRDSNYKSGQISDWENKSEYPVVNVNWYDSIAFCKWLNTTFRNELPADYMFRLPSEMEWEKASRGEHGNVWPWGNTFPSFQEFDVNFCNSRELGINDTSPVGSYSPQGDSPYGAVDMAGNVWEWTRSLWGRVSMEFRYPYHPEDGREDLSSPEDITRILRGGCYFTSRSGVRCAFRFGDTPNVRLAIIGFRVAVLPFKI